MLSLADAMFPSNPEVEIVCDGCASISEWMLSSTPGASILTAVVRPPPIGLHQSRYRNPEGFHILHIDFELS